jgi:hypothetical protein
MSEKKSDETNLGRHRSPRRPPPGTKQASINQAGVKARWSRWQKILAAIAGIVTLVAAVIAIIKDGPSAIEAIKRSIVGIKQPPSPPSPQSFLPPPPEGLILFEPNEWYENAQDRRNEVLQKRSARLKAELRKVGMGIPNAEVERNLTYRKPHNDVLEIDYTALNGKEMAVHYLIVDLPNEPSGVSLDGYEDGYVFLRMKRVPGKKTESREESPATFRLDLRQVDTWSQGGMEPSSSKVKPNETSGWWDVRILIRPYWNDLKAKPGGSEGPRLNQLQIVFGDRYRSPPAGCYWLSTIRLVKASKK